MLHFGQFWAINDADANPTDGIPIENIPIVRILTTFACQHACL